MNNTDTQNNLPETLHDLRLHIYDLQAENRGLRRNIRDLQYELSESYKRIFELRDLLAENSVDNTE